MRIEEKKSKDVGVKETPSNGGKIYFQTGWYEQVKGYGSP